MPRQPWDISRDMFLTDGETAALLDHVRQCELDADDKRRMAAATDRVLIETLLFTGIRNSELCRIRLKDVQLGAKDSLIYIRGKCRERRSVHIPAALDSLLTRFIKVTRPALLKTGVKPSDPSQPLFINEHHRAFERTTLYRRVVRILTEAGMGSRASVQLLRHTYGYLAYLKTKGNLLFVQRQLGHAHPMITSIYAQFVEEPYDQMANQIVAGLCD